MYQILYCLFIFSIISDQLWSQVKPKEYSELNYRLIGFSFPGKGKINKCKLEIASGNYDEANAFEKNIIESLECKARRIIAKVPLWGKPYTWRVVYENDQAKIIKSPLYHFSTLPGRNMDTSNVRLRVMENKEKYKDAYVLLDHNKAMYDMNGDPVWFLPDMPASKAFPRDLKLSPQGTITFLLKGHIYEVNYDGTVVWQGPNTGEVSGDREEYYNHEFTRLNNGHYMVLGEESRYWNPELKNGKIAADAGKTDMNASKSQFGTLIEYDEKGKEIWSWKSSGYFLHSDLYHNTPGSLLTPTIDVHINSFYFDEKAKIIYVSFRNISRIVKLKYPEGKVLDTYGEIYKAGLPEKGNNLFCQQHSIKWSEKGYLYMFNNNSCNPKKLPTVLAVQKAPNGDMEKTWEYVCSMDGNYTGSFIQGGNVIELSDNLFFVSMGVPYSKIFIVNRDKEILWSALPEKWNPDQKKWDVIGQYRSSIILDKKKLEKLIWNTEE